MARITIITPATNCCLIQYITDSTIIPCQNHHSYSSILILTSTNTINIITAITIHLLIIKRMDLSRRIRSGIWADKDITITVMHLIINITIQKIATII